MSHCYKCNLPQFSGVSGYVGPMCKCFTHYAPAPDAAQRAYPGAYVPPPITEETVRRIIREELARAASLNTGEPDAS